MKRVIFICTGNTCRSPMAEGLFRKYLKDNKIKDIDVSSAGLYCSVGDKPCENAVIAAREAGADIQNHRSNKLTANDFDDNTYFICMTMAHKQTIQQIKSDLKVMSLNISDPFGGNLEVYRQTAAEIISRFGDVVEFVNAQYKISPMTAQDIKQVAQIEKECFSLPWSEKSLSEELDNNLARFYVARDRIKAVGYIGAFNVCGEVSVTNVAVKREFQSRGIASMLIGYLITEMKNEGAQFITLEVRKSNSVAIGLYEKNGFQFVGERRGFYDNPKEDAALMTKYL